MMPAVPRAASATLRGFLCRRPLHLCSIARFPGSYDNSRKKKLTAQEKDERNHIIKSYYNENKLLFGNIIKNVEKKEPEEVTRRIVRKERKIKYFIRKDSAEAQTSVNEELLETESQSLKHESNSTEESSPVTRNQEGIKQAEPSHRDASSIANTGKDCKFNQLRSNVLARGSPIQEARDAVTLLSFPLINSLREDLEAGVRANCPSVTQILQQTMSAESKKALDDWKNRMITTHGLEGFQKLQRKMLDEGIILHDCIHEYLEGNRSVEIPRECTGYWKALEDVLPKVTEAQLLEHSISHPFLGYKGKVDCCASFNNTLCVIEWKTSRRSRATIRQLYDYPIQAAAYIGAINASNTNIKVAQAVIVVSYWDSPAHVHILQGETLNRYWKLWLQKLHKYWMDQS